MRTQRLWPAIALAALLMLPAVALSAQGRPGTFQGKKGVLAVKKTRRGEVIYAEEITCQQQGNYGTSISGAVQIPVSPSGSFSYHGRLQYSSNLNQVARESKPTVRLSGRFTSPTRVSGKLTGGPGSCRSVTFALAASTHATGG
jgi:hypothetical protein